MITPEPPAGSEHYREGWRHGYEQAAIDRERSADAARPHHLVTSHWDAAGGEVLYRSCTCGEEWARDEDRCPEDDIETLDVADLLDRLDLIQARNPDGQRHLDDTLDALRRELAEPSAGAAQAPDVAALRTALQRVADVLDFADDAIDPPITTEIDTNIVRMALLDTEDAPPAELRHRVRALLGTDTTPEARQ